MAGTPLSGTDGRISSGGTPLNLDHFVFTPEAADVESTNFESGGFEEGLMTVKRADVEMSGMYDAASPPFNAAQGPLSNGSIIGPVSLYVSKTLNKFILCPLVRVVSAQVQNDVKDKVRVTIRAKTQGPYFLPT